MPKIGLVHVQSRLEPDLHKQFEAYKQANDMNEAEAVRACIDAQITGRKDLKERGYKDAKLRVMHKVRKALRELVDKDG